MEYVDFLTGGEPPSLVRAATWMNNLEYRMKKALIALAVLGLTGGAAVAHIGPPQRQRT